MNEIHMDREQQDALVRQWLKDYQNGDTEALGKLVNIYQKPLFGFIYRMTQSREEAEEIFQEVWLKAIRNLDRFDQRKMLSWLFRISRNLVIDRVRKRRPVVSLQAPDANELTMEDKLEAGGLSPHHVTAGKEIGRRIQAAVDRLPPEQREVFLLRTEADLPFKEIAEIQGTSINTALGRMHYALGHLRNFLKEAYQEVTREEE